MYNESYEEYIRSILGYPNYASNMFENNYQYSNVNYNYREEEQNLELESCYPEIYKLVYPMVNKACTDNTRTVTKELIEELTNEIYMAVEVDFEETRTENSSKSVNNRNTSSASSQSLNSVNKSPVRQETSKENRGEDRVYRNRGLQDLIRILLIRELIGKPGRFPGNRRPQRPGGGIPQFPGVGMQGIGRPQMFM